MVTIRDIIRELDCHELELTMAMEDCARDARGRLRNRFLGIQRQALRRGIAALEEAEQIGLLAASIDQEEVDPW